METENMIRIRADRETPRVRAEAAEALFARIAAATAPTTTEASSASSSPSNVGAVKQAGTLGFIAGLAIGVGAMLWIGRANDAPSRVRVLPSVEHRAVLPRPRALPGNTQSTASSVNHTPIPIHAEPVAAVHARPSVARTPEDPSSERLLLHAALAAVRAHDGATATRLLDEHRQRFPNGFFREECEWLRVRAAAGQREREIAASEDYMTRYPDGVHRAQALALIPAWRRTQE